MHNNKKSKYMYISWIRTSVMEPYTTVHVIFSISVTIDSGK